MAAFRLAILLTVLFQALHKTHAGISGYFNLLFQAIHLAVIDEEDKTVLPESTQCDVGAGPLLIKKCLFHAFSIFPMEILCFLFNAQAEQFFYRDTIVFQP